MFHDGEMQPPLLGFRAVRAVVGVREVLSHSVVFEGFGECVGCLLDVRPGQDPDLW